MPSFECAQCHHVNPPGDGFCGSCGASLPAAAAVAIRPVNHARIRTAIAVIAVLAFATTAIFLFQREGSDEHSAARNGHAAAGAPPASGIETPAAGSTAAIAINAGGDEVYFAAVFDADGNRDGRVTVPEGFWYLVTFDPASGAHRSPEPISTDGVEALRIEQATERVPGTLEQQHAAFDGLLRYFITFQVTYLFSLDTFTNSFTVPLLDPSVQIDAAHAEVLNRALAGIDAAAADARDGIGFLGAQASTVGPGAGPSFGMFDFLKDRVQDPIKARDRGKKARQDVALAFGRMTISQQRAAFRVVHVERGLASDAIDSATFVEMLDRGELDNETAQIRLQLQNDGDFYQYFDLRNIETARSEGAALVIDGANFYGKAVKDVLDKTFPGIAQGWDLVEKLEKNLQKAGKGFANATIIANYLRQHGQRVTGEQAAALAAAIDATAHNMAGGSSDDGAGAFDAARIGVPIGRIDGADGARKKLLIVLQYDNPRKATMSLRCKYTGPASADASTQSLSDAAGLATFTFDAGYAPKAGTYSIECSLDDYIKRSATFSFGAVTPTPGPDSGDESPALEPTFALFLGACQTPIPDLTDPTDFLGAGEAVTGLVESICQAVLGTATALAADHAPAATPTPPPRTSSASAPTCVPKPAGSYDPVAGLAGGPRC